MRVEGTTTIPAAVSNSNQNAEMTNEQVENCEEKKDVVETNNSECEWFYYETED